MFEALKHVRMPCRAQLLRPLSRLFASGDDIGSNCGAMTGRRTTIAVCVTPTCIRQVQKDEIRLLNCDAETPVVSVGPL